jgi:hypothetical protein
VIDAEASLTTETKENHHMPESTETSYTDNYRSAVSDLAKAITEVWQVCERRLRRRPWPRRRREPL